MSSSNKTNQNQQHSSPRPPRSSSLLSKNEQLGSPPLTFTRHGTMKPSEKNHQQRPSTTSSLPTKSSFQYQQQQQPREPPGLATFSFPIETEEEKQQSKSSRHHHHNTINTSNNKHNNASSTTARVPSMRHQIGYALDESRMEASVSFGATTTNLTTPPSSPLMNNKNSSPAETNSKPSFQLPSMSPPKSISNNNPTSVTMDFTRQTLTKEQQENIRREHAANALAEALLRWPSSANPLRAPSAETNIKRRIAAQQQHHHNKSGGPTTTVTTMADTVLEMIDVCNNSKSIDISSLNSSSSPPARHQRKRRNTVIAQNEDGDFEAVDPSLVQEVSSGNHSKNANENPQQQHHAHKYPPKFHRPAQRDFLSWSSGAADGFESFASVNRWVDWVLQEAQFHSNRIAKEEANKRSNKPKDALDLAEVMKSGLGDGMLVDSAVYYSEIQEKANEINQYLRAWSRVQVDDDDAEGYDDSKDEKRSTKSSGKENKKNPVPPLFAANDEDGSLDGALFATTKTKNTSGPGETFLVRAGFLILDRVLSSSTLMASTWPRIRIPLLKGLFVKGDAILSDLIKEKKKKKNNTENTNSNNNSSSLNLTTEEISRCLANNSLIMEQYDELLSQFREAERQRFHLESTTSQLSAFSDLTARHTNRRLTRAVFKAWRHLAREGKNHERLIVHFARQAKAKEICGRNLHRWRSYMQMQRRNKAVKYADEIRRKMNLEKAEHENILNKFKEEHEKVIGNYEIRLLHLQQQYDAAVEGANLERSTLEGEIENLSQELDKAQHHAQQWRTAALLSRPTEGPDAIALYSNDERQKQSVAEMSLALAPPSKKLQVLISAVRGTEDALYLATIRTAQEAAKNQAAKIAAQKRQVLGEGNNNNLNASSIASPTSSSLARSANNLARSMMSKSMTAGATTLAMSTRGRSGSPRGSKKKGDGDSASSPSSKDGIGLNETITRFSPGQELPSMEFNLDGGKNNNENDDGDDNKSKRSASPTNSNVAKPAFKLFVKNDDEPLLTSTLNSSSLAKTLRSSTTANALQSKPEMNFQALAAAGRESIQAFLVEWVNEMLAKSSQGRNMMHAGVQRTTAGATIAKTVTNLDTDLYDGSVYLSLCKAIIPPEHQRKGDADVFSTIVSTLFVFTAHGLQPPLIVHCPFYRRFFRSDTFGTFIHPTAGLWIVASLFCGYALRSAQSPNYRAHPALSPVHQYSPSGHHKVSKQHQQQLQQKQKERFEASISPGRSSSPAARSSRRGRNNNNDDNNNNTFLTENNNIPVSRPPMNILIMSGVNTCGYGTKKAFQSSVARGDAALLHRLGVSLEKTIGSAAKDKTEQEDQANDDDDEFSASTSRRLKRRKSKSSFGDESSLNDFDEDTEFNDDDEDEMFNGSGTKNYHDGDENDDEEQEDDEDGIVEEIDDGELPAVSSSPGGRGGRKQSNFMSPEQQKEIMDNWLLSKEAVEAAQKAVPDHLLHLGPTELLQYWKTAQENRSIWIGMARVITSLAVRFRIFDIDTKRTEQNTARRHLQPHMTSMMTSELKVDSTSSPSRGMGTFK